MTELRLVIDGAPNTDHRPRAGRAGKKIVMRESADYAAWKRRVALEVASLRPARWPTDARYAVEVIGFMTAARVDADNLRGFLDACEGVLWKNDRQCRPVVYDYRVDKQRPRIEVQIVAFDPDSEHAEIEVVIRKGAG